MVGVRLNVPPAMPYADILLLAVNLTSLPSFIQIGPKLPKFEIWGGLGVGRVVGGLTIPPDILQAHILLPNKYETSPPRFIQIGPKLTKFFYLGWFRGDWGGLNVPPAMPYADILLVILNCTSPPSFTQIGPKLPMIDVGWFLGGWGGWLGWDKHGQFHGQFQPSSVKK